MTDAPVRRRLPSADRRRQILEAGARLFVERGYEAVTMGDLAAFLGISRPAIYSYFTSTEGLLDALLDERLDALLARLEPLLEAFRPAPDGGPPPPGGIEALFRLLLSEPDTLALLHSGSGPGFRARRRAFLDGLGARLPLDPNLPVRRHARLLLVVTTLLDGLAHRAATDPDVDPDRLARTVDLFVRGGAREVVEHETTG